MNDLEDMKALWLELNRKVTNLENENRKLARMVINEKYISARERLIRKYNAFIGVEIIMIIFIFNFIWFNPLVVEKYRIITSIYWVGFFLLEISFDYFLKVQVKRIDIINSSVRDISNLAAKNWRLHKIAILISFPLAIGACVLFAFALNANEFTIFGMIFGGAVGILIGLMQLNKFRENYHLLQTSDE